MNIANLFVSIWLLLTLLRLIYSPPALSNSHEIRSETAGTDVLIVFICSLQII